MKRSRTGQHEHDDDFNAALRFSDMEPSLLSILAYIWTSNQPHAGEPPNCVLPLRT
jgi:hypothetical protein